MVPRRVDDPDSLLLTTAVPEGQDDEGDRGGVSPHRQSTKLAGLLERIARGRAAAQLLPPDALTAVGTVVVWPLFTLRLPMVNLGRKATGGHAHPVRIDYNGRPLVESVLTDDIQTLRGCRVIGLGNDEAHEAVGQVPQGRDAERVLLALMADGQSAHWEFRAEMEPIIAKYVAEANSSLHQELLDYWRMNRAQRPLDDVMLEQVQMGMLYGKVADQHGTRAARQDRAGSVDRLIDKLIGDPRVLAKVDLIMLITRTLRRDAWQEVRSILGDPRAGSKIRRVAMELGVRDVRAVHARYAEQHPSDAKISLTRVAQALAVTPGTIAVDVSQDLAHLLDGSSEYGVLSVRPRVRLSTGRSA